MRTSIRITLDGLMRALRWQAHDLAEELEQRYRAGMRKPGVAVETGERIREMGEGNDRVGR
ncbi:hypothetical protein [Pseudaminobacter soli (ex Li et al. 2025)]|uniref:hypothetical protein n=1 Tax=Pseudaminobacter soli (ex Li et al. 2025) TaxID=1295366 RepID=UPI000D0E394E|nr:hypothetical protein [Mesorhizobium soli]